jgi:hypothetical protein
MSENRSPEEILARRLDQVLPPDRTNIPGQTPDPLVNMAARMAALWTSEPSEIAVNRMEARMLAAFDRIYRAQPQRQPRQWVGQMSRWAAAASLVLVLLMVGATSASAGSLPGEPLYPVKLLIEGLELTFAASPDVSANLKLHHAELRAQEALTLLDRGQYDETLIQTALRDLRDAEQEASNNLASSLTFQWQQQRVTELIGFTVETARERAIDPEPPAAVVTSIPTNMATSSPAAPTQTATRTPRPSRTPRATATLEGTPTPSSQPTGPFLRSHTPLPTAANTPCPGNSCNSAGVPGGQINPQTPPGQSGGHNENPPDPPGQGNPGGGQENNPGQGNGNSGGNSENGQGNGH